jgi:hypothetical protein
LAAGSCTSATNCFAVGDYASATTCIAVGTSYPSPPSFWKILTERWNGKTWTVVGGAIPAGVTRTTLWGVSCTSATSCFSAGASWKNGGDQFLVERYDGTKWSIACRPNVAGLLRGMSCTSTTRCVAVGGGAIARLAPA